MEVKHTTPGTAVKTKCKKGWLKIWLGIEHTIMKKLEAVVLYGHCPSPPRLWDSVGTVFGCHNNREKYWPLLGGSHSCEIPQVQDSLPSVTGTLIQKYCDASLQMLLSLQSSVSQPQHC